MDRGNFGHGGVILDNWILSPDNNRFIDWGQFEILTSSYALTFKKISSQITYLTRFWTWWGNFGQLDFIPR